MKREYSKPAMNVEVFEASEYVAACYKINCNVPGSGKLWAETVCSHKPDILCTLWIFAPF